ncbi:MAG: Fe-S cluster assembly protein SufD [Woeseia sp.]
MSSHLIDFALLEQAVRKLPGDALHPVRANALAAFGQSEFPDQRQEDWKYTNLAPAAKLSNAWLRKRTTAIEAHAVSALLQEQIDQIVAKIPARWVVIANGLVETRSLHKLAAQQPAGLTVRSAAESAHLPTVVAGDVMSRFNAALIRDVLHIEVSANPENDKPIGILIIDDASDEASVTQTRIVIELEERAHASFIELHATAGDNQQFANCVCNMRLAGGAKARYVRIQERGLQHYQVGRLTAQLERNSELKHAAFDLGGALIRNDIDIAIREPGAAVELLGLYLASGRQHIDNHTRIDHCVGPATSREEYRGILNDRARCVFNGKAIVHAGADGTDARQSNHNLLLSDRAEIDTKPELEIYADDVKCSHGATVGQLDPKALFYLRSRGLNQSEAARALTRAFAETIVERTPVAEVRPYIQAIVDRKLQSLIDGEFA